MSDKVLPPTQPSAWPSEVLVLKLAEHPAFTQKDTATLAQISEARLQQWLTRGILTVVKRPGAGRRLFNLREAVHIAIAARIADAHDLGTATAVLLGQIGASTIVRAWAQVAVARDASQSPSPGVILENLKNHGYTFYVKPDAFGLLDRLQQHLESEIVVIPSGVSENPDCSFSFDRSVSIGEVMENAGESAIIFDLGPTCRDVVGPALDFLRSRVVVS